MDCPQYWEDKCKHGIIRNCHLKGYCDKEEDDMPCILDCRKCEHIEDCEKYQELLEEKATDRAIEGEKGERDEN